MNGHVIYLAQTPEAVAPFHAAFHSFSPDILTFLPSSSSKEAQIAQSFVVHLIVLSRRLFSNFISTDDLPVPNTLIRKDEID